MRRILFSLAIGALIAGCAGVRKAPPAAPDKAEDPLLPLDPQIRAGRLDNGFRYLIRKNQKPEKRAELRLVVDAGSVLEAEDQQGLAHFVEHMAFNGTRNFAKQQLVDYLESIGMEYGPELNAYTGFDETVYMLTVPTDTAGVVETAFQILEDWAHQVSFEDEEIDRERGVVVEEWRLGRGAEQRMLDRQLPVILKDSRYAGRLPIGQKAVLDTFRHETLRRFYRTWYRPDLMGLVAVGDFEPERIDSLARHYFSRIPPVPAPEERRIFPVPDHQETLFAVATDPEATRNSVAVYYKQDVRDQGTLGAYRRSLIESLYHRMFNQRLYELTKRPEPPFLYGSSGQGQWLRAKEFVTLGAGVQDDGFERGLEALLTEAARVRQFGFTPSELDREKAEVLRTMEQVYRERDKLPSAGFAAEYVDHLLLGEPVPGIEKEYALCQELIPGIDLDEVNTLSREWTGERNRVIVLQAPAKPELKVPGADDLLAVFRRVARQEIAPYTETVSAAPLVARVPEPARIVAQQEFPKIGATQWTLANGVRVFLKPTDFKNDEILFSACSPGGHSLVPDEDYVAAITAASVVSEGGVAGFSLIELQKKLAGKVVAVSPWIGELQEGLSGSASPQDLQTLFELIYASFTAPRQDSTAFQGFKTRMIGLIQNRSARPETAFEDTFRVTLAQHHYRARPWSLEVVAEMDLAKSMAVYRDRFADAGDFTFFFVGSFTLEQLEPLVRTYLGGLPAGGRQERWKDVGIEAPAGVVEKAVRRGIEAKSQSRIVFTGPFAYDGWRNNFLLEAAAAVLEIKLREVLREGMGGTYGVAVSAGAARYPDAEYSISLSFGCDPGRVEELTRTLFAQIDSLKDFGPAAIYVEKVKEIRKRQREVALKENGFWINALQGADSNGIDPQLVVGYADLVDSLEVGAVRAAAQQYFDTGNYVRVVLYPESGSD
jgi:zinc protease